MRPAPSALTQRRNGEPFMIALYFPFTFVRPATGWLTAAFETICLLVPSADQEKDCLAPGVDADPWRVLYPHQNDEAALRRIEAQMRQWATVHAGSDLTALLASRPEEAPFFATPEISRLRQDIRGRAGGRPPQAGQDPLLAARVFLSFAHGLDRERSELAGTWQALAAMEKEMMRQLHGQAAEAGQAASAQPAGEDPGSFLTGHRLGAWARLALTLAVAPEVLVTDSAAVFEAVRDVFPAMRPVFNWPADGMAGPDRHWADSFYAAIQDALNAKAPARSPEAASGSSLQVSALDISFADFCHGLVDGSPVEPAAGPTGDLLIVGPLA